jgi:hypothetical protein
VVSFLPPSVEALTTMNNLSLKIQRERQSIQLTLQLKEAENLPANVNNE